MRVVQALYWLRDTLPGERERILGRLTQILGDPGHNSVIGQDLKQGFSTLPSWMQQLLQPLLGTGTMVRPRRATVTPKAIAAQEEH
jgi:hypothetical protein